MENEQKIKMSPLWFGTITLLTLLQVGFTATFAFYILNEFTLGRVTNVLALLNVGVILAVDVFILYWLVKLAAKWEPAEEEAAENT